MKKIVPNDFRDFYHALWERDPFPWQERVAKRIAGGERWSRGVALPTGSGKTSCLEIALFALACQAALPVEERSAPRRIFFVIDRRVVVDEAHEHALKLAERLSNAQAGPLAKVAENLRELSHSGAAVTVHRMRGGTLRDIGWTRNPSQPAIILSTVDQIGSRMLFRGYGVSRRMGPVHAALAVNDSLILLDEAHCARPFASTAAAIERYRMWAEQPILLPFQTVVLSATLPPELGSDVESLDADDRKHDVLGARLKASKLTRLVIAKNARGDRAMKGFVGELAQEARAMIGRGRKTVAVMVNRVHTARLVRDFLRGNTDFDVLLMTGRMRPLDRDALIKEWKSKIDSLESGEESLPRPIVLVSTQCLEVGANLSFEGLVTECASLDALRQRFGRLNRFAERPQSDSCEAAVMIQPSQVKESDEDPIYGSSLAETWKWLESIAAEQIVDFGIDAMTSSAETLGESLAALLAPAPEAPVMLPAYLDFWAQTSPRPAPDPDPAVFLHGIERGSPDVQICWRADLSPENVNKWPEIVSMLPPTPGETLQVPLWIARAWIAGTESAGEDLSDVETVSSPELKRTQRATRRALRWRGTAKSIVIDAPSDVRPGDTLVLAAWGAAEMSGEEIERRWGGVGHFYEGTDGHPRMDLAETSYVAARDFPVLRITEGAVPFWGGPVARSRLAAFFAPREDLTDDQLEVLKEALAGLRDELQDDRIVTVLDALLRNWGGMSVHLHPAGGVVLKGRQRLSAEPAPPPEELLTDEEEFDTSRSTRHLPLEVHLRDVERRSRNLAISCGLSREIAEIIALAGRLHDIGKADIRFQLMLHRGDEWFAAVAGGPLAKSPDIPLFGHAARRIRKEIGLPQGFRHELLSVRMAEASSQVTRRAGDSTDLMLHLIASHHGYCRPFAPVVLDEHPVDVAFNVDGSDLRSSSATGLALLDSGVADRFWRLLRKYGWWGLSYLEAIMRLADHLESERREGEGLAANDTATLSVSR